MTPMVGDARGTRHRPDGMRRRHPRGSTSPAHVLVAAGLRPPAAARWGASVRASMDLAREPRTTTLRLMCDPLGTGARRAEPSGEPEPPVAPGDAERGDDPGRADGDDDRVAVEGRAAEHAVEDDPRRGTDGDPDHERPRAHARETARVIEGAGGEAGRAADERDAPGAAALQPAGDAAGPVRQPIGQR